MPNNTCPMSGSKELKVSADVKGLDEGRDFVVQSLSEMEAGPEATFSLTTSFLELFENLIRHGYGGESGHATIGINVNGEGAMLTVTDMSGEFDILRYDGPDQAAMIKSGITGKMGIKTIKVLCDSVAYKREGNMNKYILKKKRG